MSKIKIISNPYVNKISYERYNGSEWEKIEDESSGLIRAEYQNGVFPFFAKKVVDIILEEFKESDQKLDLVFEGTDDEFRDLKKLCAGENYKPKINVIKSNRYLKNGSAIIKNVEEIFDKMTPLIHESICDSDQIQREMQQFKDVTKKAIPICVIGNYSAGKSTFINALIGREILPSGDQPLTSRIYRIEESKYENKASISFAYEGRDISITFEDGECTIVGKGDFLQKVADTIEAMETKDVTYQLNKALEIINDIGNNEPMSYIIKLVVPFNREGIFGKSKKEFVIFDTPGDNSATNINHSQVLRDAMQNLSNGLPLFVSENNKLDTTDNQKLCDDILSMPELDSKYTMIIVNKADMADLDEETFNPDRILKQAAPKRMFSGGLYYVSSILGLGAKTDGKFHDNHYAKLFRRLKYDFSGEDPECCETLYKFDIMPEQIKDRLLEEAASVENKILLNSGLHWIECEIDSFAEKYSPYNKCTQSKRFLDKVVEITMESIKSKIVEFEAAKNKFSEELDSMKSVVINKLEECNDIYFDTYKMEYSAAMNPTILEICQHCLARQALENWEKELTELIKKENDFDNRFAAQKVDGMFNQMIMNMQAAAQRRDAEKEINDYVASEIIKRVNEVYTDLSYQARNELNRVSVEYWTDKTVDLKNRLLSIIKGQSPLSDTEKDELSEIIVNYDPISFKEESIVFMKEDFKDEFVIFGIKFGTNKLRYSSLLNSFKKTLESFVNKSYTDFKESHRLEFEKWSDTLMQRLKENAVKYNPELAKQNGLIMTQQNEILRLKERQYKITRYIEDIGDMMSWKERETE